MASKRPRRERQPSGLTVALAFGVAVAAAVALVALALVSRNDDSETTPPTATPVVNLNGIPQSRRVLGDARAGVTLIEYADLQCPACRAYTESVFPGVVNEYVRDGRVNTEFRGYPFIGPDSVKAQRFVLAAGRQDRLWNLAEALYRYQGGENDGWVTDDLVRRLAGEIQGLDVSKLFADAGSDAIASAVEQDRDQAETAGIPGTPTFLIRIDGEEPYVLSVGLDLDQFRAALDDALAG